MRQPEAVAVTAIGTVVIVLAAYLVMVTVAGVVLRVVGAHLLARALDAITPRVARQIVAAVMGAAMAAPTAAVAAQTDDPPVVMQRLPDETTESTTTTTMPTPAPDVTSGSPEPVTPPAPRPPAAGGVTAPPVQPTTWTIEPGQHFWAVAEHVVTDASGRTPSIDEIVPYWLDLIEANRDRLVDPANADLVFPGQELVLPPTG